MKKIEAIVKPFRLDAVKDALLEIGIPGVTVGEVRGFGRQGGRGELYRGAEYVRDFIPKSRLEIVVPDDAVEKVTAVLLEHCRTGKIGDGIIVVGPCHDAIRIRTGESGDEVMQ